MNFKQRYLHALRREPVDRVPVPAFCSHPLVELMKYTGLFSPGIHSNLKDMVEFALAAAEILEFEGVRLPTDGVIEAEALGCKVAPGDMNRNPAVIDHPFSLDGIEVPVDFFDKGRIPLNLEAVKTLKTRVGNEVPVTAQFVGPATIASHLVGLPTFLRGLLKNQEAVKRVLAAVTNVCIQMGNALGAAGADALQFPDPMASSDIIGPHTFAEFIRPCYKKIFQNVDCLVVLHICGNSRPILPLLKETGAAGFSFDAEVDVSHARQILGDEMALVGNISTTRTLLHGSKADVQRESIKAIQDGVNILAPSCGFPPHTPLANIKVMIQSAKLGPNLIKPY